MTTLQIASACRSLGKVNIDFSDLSDLIETNSDLFWSLYKKEQTPIHIPLKMENLQDLYFFKGYTSYLVTGKLIDNLPSVKLLRQHFSEDYKLGKLVVVVCRGNILRHKDLDRKASLNIGIKNSSHTHTLFWSDNGDLVDSVRYHPNECAYLNTSMFHSVYVDDSIPANLELERVVISMELLDT